MNKTSVSTFYFKKLFPIVRFGFLGFFLIIFLSSGAEENSPMFDVAPLIVMAVFG